MPVLPIQMHALEEVVHDSQADFVITIRGTQNREMILNTIRRAENKILRKLDDWHAVADLSPEYQQRIHVARMEMERIGATRDEIQNYDRDFDNNVAAKITIPMVKARESGQIGKVIVQFTDGESALALGVKTHVSLDLPVWIIDPGYARN